MDKETQEELDLLRGRVVALEELMVNFIALQADQYAVPKQELLRNWLKAMKQAAQHAPRAVDPRSDAAWEAAAQSLENLFARAAATKAE